MMTPSTFRGGGTSAASILASRRSMRRALGFMGAGPLARSVCPVASNPVGDLVHAGFELLWLLRLKARAHYAQAIADTGGSRSRASFSRRVMNVRSAASVGLGRGVRVGAMARRVSILAKRRWRVMSRRL